MAMDEQQPRLQPNHQEFIDRFMKACRADERVVAAFLGGSYAKGKADKFSDLDLCLITTDAAYDEFYRQRERFLRQLGELVFLEDFGTPNISFYIFEDGTEGELNYGSEGRLDQIHSGLYHVLLDKKNILKGVVFSEPEADPTEQLEKLRSNIYGFWHELSHFITAIGRGQLWWAQGQLEALRSICVNLARLQNNFSDEGVGEEAYFKVEGALPVQKLQELKETFGPMEKNAMLESVRMIVQFYREITPSLAELHGVIYPHALEKLMTGRLDALVVQQC